MPLDPLAQAFLDQQTAAGVRPACELSVEAARRQAIETNRRQPPGQPVASVLDRVLECGDRALPARIYTPRLHATLPILVYFHGGGWVLGDLDANDVRCRALANGADCVVISVNYRHAPEFRFPIPVEDAYAATCWAAENPGLVNGDAARIAVGGASAGGNLAAAVALMARDRGGPALVFQSLLVPATNHGLDLPSCTENAEGYGLTRKSMEWFWGHYLTTPEEGAHPYASPLAAPSLASLPRAHVLAAQFDPLRDQAQAYATRLAQAGVPTVLTTCEGMLHGFWGDAALRLVTAELKKGLWAPASAGTSRAEILKLDDQVVASAWPQAG